MRTRQLMSWTFVLFPLSHTSLLLRRELEACCQHAVVRRCPSPYSLNADRWVEKIAMVSMLSLRACQFPRYAYFSFPFSSNHNLPLPFSSPNHCEPLKCKHSLCLLSSPRHCSAQPTSTLSSPQPACSPHAEVSVLGSMFT